MRSFIAVKISDEQREKIAEIIRELKKTRANVKWVAPQNLHITLKFLGEVDEKSLPNLYTALEKSLTNEPTAQFNLRSLGSFPSRQRPRVIWVGIEQGAKELAGLAGKVDEAMAAHGFPKESRPFSPHLTIGRVKDARGIETVTGKFDELKFETGLCPINEVIYFQSILRPEGPTYVPQRIVKLQKMEREG